MTQFYIIPKDRYDSTGKMGLTKSPTYVNVIQPFLWTSLVDQLTLQRKWHVYVGHYMSSHDIGKGESHVDIFGLQYKNNIIVWCGFVMNMVGACNIFNPYHKQNCSSSYGRKKPLLKGFFDPQMQE